MYICIMYVYFTEQQGKKRKEKREEQRYIYVLYIRVCVSKREREVIYR